MALGGFLSSVWHSKLFWVIVVTFFITHTIKFIVHYYRFRKFSIKPFLMTGGMPSSHTATTVAMTTAIAFETGASPLFFVCFLFTLITIRDSYGVRKSVSDQAHLINALTSEMKIHKKAKIVLGHTPLQVFVGFVIGLAVGLGMYLI